MAVLTISQMIIDIIAGIIALATVIIAVVKWVKNGNAKKVLALISSVPELVKQAEQMFGSGHGADKFRWVMTMLKNQALASKTRVADEILENAINDVVDTTNNVNIDKFPFSNKETNTGINTENQLATQIFKNGSDVSETV